MYLRLNLDFAEQFSDYQLRALVDKNGSFRIFLKYSLIQENDLVHKLKIVSRKHNGDQCNIVNCVSCRI